MVMAGTSESSTLHFFFQGHKAVSDTKKSQTCLDPDAGRETADAVGQNLWLFEHNAMEFLVLAGYHLYRMDYERFIQAHRETDADITLPALPMDEKHATAFSLMKIDEKGRIIQFAEKPKGEQLKTIKVHTTILGLDDERAKEMPSITSMGIYVVSKDVMLNLLEPFHGANYFGSQVILSSTSVGMRVLKEGCIIILTRNINPTVGLCNGTLLICNKFYNDLIDAEIVTGSCKGQTTFIPKITLKPSADVNLPFSSTRKEFPIRLLH